MIKTQKAPIREPLIRIQAYEMERGSTRELFCFNFFFASVDWVCVERTNRFGASQSHTHRLDACLVVFGRIGIIGWQCLGDHTNSIPRKGTLDPHGIRRFDYGRIVQTGNGQDYRIGKSSSRPIDRCATVRAKITRNFIPTIGHFGIPPYQ